MIEIVIHGGGGGGWFSGQVMIVSNRIIFSWLIRLRRTCPITKIGNNQIPLSTLLLLLWFWFGSTAILLFGSRIMMILMMILMVLIIDDIQDNSVMLKDTGNA